jgi:hypothetical protein
LSDPVKGKADRKRIMEEGAVIGGGVTAERVVDGL